ncbi:MAG: ferric reductase-like transmembrane domain-containing protein [Planctomycetota bacterium]
MGHAYQAVQWNRQKRRYDLALLGGVVLYLGAFVGVTSALQPEATAETLLIRGLGTAAFLLLHVVLAIGPLARLDRRWLPLLYNRRHLGVTMCALALLHGGFSLVQFHAFGDVNPLVSLLSSNTRFDSVADFPFQPLGAAALVILVLMAATSHDFWLANLTAPVWKALHMLVYVAYALIALHVALGVLQAETSPVLWGAVAAGALALGTLHLLAARKDAADDTRATPAAAPGPWIDACAVSEIREGRAKVIVAGGERVAIFRHGGRLSALSGVCQHQNGPLGEGRVVDGLVVCPWHGYQYRPQCGSSPAPFHERVPTFRLQVEAGRVLLDPRPVPLGTELAPVATEEAAP